MAGSAFRGETDRILPAGLYSKLRGNHRVSLGILVVASESAPFIKTGGLGDVVGSLSAEMAQRSHDVTLVLPYYADLKIRVGEPPVVGQFSVLVGETLLHAQIRELRAEAGVRVLFLDQPESFARPGVYVDPTGRPFDDNDVRFVVLAKGALLAADLLNIPVDIVHAHDWPAGMVPVYARTLFHQSPRWRQAGMVFTLHNIEFQGRFPRSRWYVAGLDESLFSIDGLEFWGDWSMLKGGLLWGDQLTTVSPTYAIEIRTPEMGFGFDGVVRRRVSQLTGVINGIDIQAWNPAVDPNLPLPYDVTRWRAGKTAAKRLLESKTQLKVRDDVPLVGMVGRLTHQKGIDLLGGIAKDLLEMNLQLVILGVGEPALEGLVRQFAACYPDRVWTKIDFDEQLAHLIYAGSDLFLMPSRSEPCGLSQLYALRYGSVPIVHATGGLADTVRDATPENLRAGTANGFHFEEFSAAGLASALSQARQAYATPSVWEKLVARGMSEDWSWSRSAKRYEEIYSRALRAVRT